MRQAHFKFISTLPAATFLLTSCSGGEVSGLGFEEGVSSVNDQSLSLWQGAWIAAFMIQMQNLPGVTNQLEFSATKLGTFPGRCNILCGRNHSQMLFNVKVVTPAEYESYIQSLVAEEKAVIS